MILRRFRERVRAQDWFGVGVEVAIVIVGVFIGLQGNNWNNDRIASEQARAYRAEIVEEFRSNQSSIATMSAYYASVRAHAIATLTALNAPRIANGQEFLIDAFQATQILPRPLRIDTYEQIRATPVINSVASLPLQRQLANYDANVTSIEITLGSITPYRDLARARMPFVVQEKIQAACGDHVVIARTNGLTTIALPDTCAPGLTAGEVADGVAALRAASDLGIALNRQISDLDQKLRLLDGLRTRTEGVARNLERAL